MVSGPGAGSIYWLPADCADIGTGPVELPSRLSFAEAWQLRPTSAGPLWGLVGVGGDTLAALGPDLAAGTPGFIVAGPAKSGRSTILLSMARSFLAAGTPVILAAPRPSPLRALAVVPRVLPCSTSWTWADQSWPPPWPRSSGPVCF